MRTRGSIRLYRVRSVGLDDVREGEYLVVIVGFSNLKQRSDSCGKLSWNCFLIERFAPKLIREDVTDTNIKYLISTKKVVKVFEMSYNVFQEGSSTIAVR